MRLDLEKTETNVMPGLILLMEHKRYKQDVGFTCEARDVGLDCYAECLEADTESCPFSVTYGRSHFCTSPARVYIAKESEK